MAAGKWLRALSQQVFQVCYETLHRAQATDFCSEHWIPMRSRHLALTKALQSSFGYLVELGSEREEWYRGRQQSSWLPRGESLASFPGGRENFRLRFSQQWNVCVWVVSAFLYLIRDVPGQRGPMKTQWPS